MSASFGAPATGGAATRTRRALSRTPEISVLRDRGIRRTFSSTPVGVGRTTALTSLRRHRTQPGQKKHRHGLLGPLQFVRFVVERDALDNPRTLEDFLVALAAFQLADVVESIAQGLDGRFD